MAATVTVVLPVYNGEPFLAQALDSLLQQTYLDWELLAIDDGSVDGTGALLENYARQHSRIMVLRQENQGLIATLNRGIQQCTGRFLARMDADDLAHPERLALQVAYLEAHPATVICGSGFLPIDVHGQFQAPDAPAGGRTGTPPNEPVVSEMPVDDTSIRWCVLFHSPFAHPSVCLRTEALRQHGLQYDPQAYLVEDYALWSSLLRYGGGFNFPQPLLQYRQHERQVSRQQQETQEMNANRVSQANLACLGVALSLPEVAVLRQWYHRFPARLGPAQAGLCQALLDILNAFSAQPGLEAQRVRQIRGRWLMRLLLTPAQGLGRSAWLAKLQAGDLMSILQYGLHKLGRPAGGRA